MRDHYNTAYYERAQIHVYSDGGALGMTLYLIPPQSAPCVYDKIEITSDMVNEIMDDLRPNGRRIITLDGYFDSVPLPAAVWVANRIVQLVYEADKAIFELRGCECDPSKVPGILASLSYSHLIKMQSDVDTTLERLHVAVDKEAIVTDGVLRLTDSGNLEGLRRVAKLALTIERALKEYDVEAKTKSATSPGQ